MSYTTIWTLGMSAIGLLAAAITLLITHSIGWAGVGLVGSGVATSRRISWRQPNESVRVGSPRRASLGG